jgi:hypothetical protein
MRQHYVHRTLVRMQADADRAALGGAVTMALCGSWDHVGLCRWPHNSRPQDRRDFVALRTVFVAESADEQTIRDRIDEVLCVGSLTAPDGTPTRWRVHASNADSLTDEDNDLAARLSGHPA